MRGLKHIFILCILALVTAQLSARPTDSLTVRIQDSINTYLSRLVYTKYPIMLDSITSNDDSVKVYFKKRLREFPYRKNDIDSLYNIVESILPCDLQEHTTQIYCAKTPLEYYISDYYSNRKAVAHRRTPYKGAPWIEKPDRPYSITEGLDKRYIAIWAGHGYYYNPTDSVWKWQRAPLFTTIEDIFPHTYLIDFIIPMLENAGAYVFTPRERDYNTDEIIIDNGSPFYTERNINKRLKWSDSQVPGYAEVQTIYSSDTNPFTNGKSRIISAARKSTRPLATYLPWFPKSAEYAVYVSYESLPESGIAAYSIRHSGGTETITLDQSRGGSTWIYLGTYHFTEGESGQGVSIYNPLAQSKKVITTDAVRFGGGMGIIARDSTLSGLPKFLEAGRYSLQAYGFPQQVFNPKGDTDDYKDDYISKGLWVNALKNDFNIPVDMALAVHTDAGTRQCDSIVGTLAIYKEVSDNSYHYSDGSPRRTARELADIVQSSIIEDIKALYRNNWSRRGLWDRSYMEARTPDVPTTLIEMFSHQNANDMECGLDPKFRFIISRAIYKGVLKYLSYVYNTSYTVQPYPVRNFAADIKEINKKAKVFLTWSPTDDSLEPSAKPTSYLIQTRITDTSSRITGFDRGIVVKDTSYTMLIESGKIYSFKVTALNKGGASFPSEILSVGYLPKTPKTLLVNAYTDVCGTDFATGKRIPYIRDYSYIGTQYDFDTTSVWISDDQPGFGASHTDSIGHCSKGNTFDYPLNFGREILHSGCSFTSYSLSAYLNSTADRKSNTKRPIYDTVFFIRSETHLEEQ